MTKETDRLTQLQECVSKLTELLFVSVGVLQRDAPLLETNPEIPVTCWTKEQIQSNWKSNQELAKSAAKDIVHLSKIIDFLIDHLPGLSEAEEDQLKELEALEAINKRVECDLQEALSNGDKILEKWKGGLDKIMTELESSAL